MLCKLIYGIFCHLFPVFVENTLCFILKNIISPTRLAEEGYFRAVKAADCLIFTGFNII